MYEQLHILSPLLPPREFMILRCCQQLEEGLWVIADVSYHQVAFEFEFGTPACYKRPSGFLIQAMPNGHSKVSFLLLCFSNRIFISFMDLLIINSFKVASSEVFTLRKKTPSFKCFRRNICFTKIIFLYFLKNCKFKKII